ncbi:transposase [Flavobacterium sp.]|uniref:transposase n=1 Tax=Flavobacterium sp. TaxID=239 RepID=UPI0035ADB078
MKNRKRNRMKGFDYSSNNLYFVTNCVKNNLCCLGNVISDAIVGTGRDLSVHHSKNHHSKNHHSKNHHSKNHHSKNHHSENHHSENHHSEINPFGNVVMELNSFGLIVKNQIEWLENQYPYISIHNYVIMPNHFHLILEIDGSKVNINEIKIKSLSSLMGALKTTSSKQIRDFGFIDFAWHRSFHDHIIRNEKEYDLISNYIDRNPQKWFEDRFYSGQLKQF